MMWKAVFVVVAVVQMALAVEFMEQSSGQCSVVLTESECREVSTQRQYLRFFALKADAGLPAGCYHHTGVNIMWYNPSTTSNVGFTSLRRGFCSKRSNTCNGNNECHTEADCVNGKCLCNPGYTGSGKQCHMAVLTQGGNNNQGVKAYCNFPFRYQGKEYFECTSAGHNELWCGTTYDASKWGNCAGKCNIPSMVHFPQINQTTLAGIGGVRDGPMVNGTMVNGSWVNRTAFMKTIAYSSVPGKEMRGGVIRLKAGESLEYNHWYETFVMVISGEVTVKFRTGNSTLALPTRSFYVRRGDKARYLSDSDAVMYFVIQFPEVEQELHQRLTPEPQVKPVEFRNTTAGQYYDNLPLFVNEQNSSSYLDDSFVSKVQGRAMTAGLYKLLAGPALLYTYEYEEFKYIVAGEFHLQDGTGKKVVAKAGDLMYFPLGVYVRFTSPNMALGFYVGQRGEGEA